MSYDAIAKALYDYTAQDPEGELSFKEDQVLYIIDKEDDQWWKAKLKPAEDDEDADEDKVGLVPATYVEEIPPISHSRALYDYAATSSDELSMTAEDLLEVFEVGAEWNLVRHSQAGGKIGFVPANYTEAVDEGTEGGVMGDEVKEVDARQPMSPGGVGRYETPQEQVVRTVSKEKDAIETWSVSILDKKGKKKKGTLGVGNGAVFFASDTDKTPVQQFPIADLQSHTQPSSKHLLLTFSSNPSEPMHFHCGSKDVSETIANKLVNSQRIASGISTSAAVSTTAERQIALPRPASIHSDEDEAPAAMAPKAVRWAAVEPPSPVAQTDGGSKAAVALYDFDAAGDDELGVREGENLVVLDDSNEDWWTVRNEHGDQGVVPAQYIELGSGGSATHSAVAETHEPIISDEEDEEEGIAEREAAAAAEAAAVRQRQSAIARAAAEAEESERVRAAEEQAKRERRERRRAEEERRRREEEAAARREAARRAAPPPEPPKLKQRPSTNDVAAARALPDPRRQPAPPPAESSRSRPNSSRTRIWHDKTGQFRVEAELLGIGNGKLRLHKLNGVVIEVPIEKMSPEDIAFIRKHHGRRSSAPPREDDDVPLARVSQGVKPSPETLGRSSPAPSAAPAANRPQAKRIAFDWFEFFLSAGCDMDDCTRYTRNFEKDRIDESILPELEPGTLRSLGLREGDVIRVRKAINARNPQYTAEQAAQIKKDEELARQLQEAENSGRPGNLPPASGSTLFTGPDGKLANNTRRGRPDRKATVSSVDADGIAVASQKLARPPSPPLLTPSPPPAPPPPAAEPTKPAPLISGFDDDAWTPRPNSAKPATPINVPTPPPMPPTTFSAPAQTNGSSLSAQLANIKLSQPQAQQNSSNFDFLSQIGQNKTGGSFSSGTGYTGAPAPPSFHAGLGMGSSQAPLGQLLQAQQTGAFQQQQPQQQQQQQNGTRGPLAPVPANQGLLNPLIPTNTGFSGFVPTRQSPNPTGMMTQQTGFQSGMMSQQTGFQPMYAQQPQQQTYMQPNMTGYPQQQPSAVFSTFAAVPQQQAPQPTEQNKFQPANIFAKMKQSDVGNSQEMGPQSSDKYDALRPQQTGMMMPLTTGYNGGMMQHPTGMMPQPTGFMMNGQNGQQQPVYMQQSGFMPGMQQQQTGYRY